MITVGEKLLVSFEVKEKNHSPRINTIIDMQELKMF